MIESWITLKTLKQQNSWPRRRAQLGKQPIQKLREREARGRAERASIEGRLARSFKCVTSLLAVTEPTGEHEKGAASGGEGTPAADTKAEKDSIESAVEDTGLGNEKDPNVSSLFSEIFGEGEDIGADPLEGTEVLEKGPASSLKEPVELGEAGSLFDNEEEEAAFLKGLEVGTEKQTGSAADEELELELYN